MEQFTNERSVVNGVIPSNIQVLLSHTGKSAESAAVGAGYAPDRKSVIKLLNEALATELVCVLRYKRHFSMATVAHSEAMKAAFLAHATEEMCHAERLAKRIVELGGVPNFSPERLRARSNAEYNAGDSLDAMLKKDLIAERHAIAGYRAMIAFLADYDPTTKRMLIEILASEEEHVRDLASMIEGVQS